MRGQTSHLDADVLAEFRAGLITGRRKRKIAAHLAGCERCAAVGAQLAELSTLLAAIPVPAMPDSVAQRLDAVLAAEVARRDAERAVVDPSREPKRAPRPARRPRPRFMTMRVLAPAAAVAVILAAGGYGLSLIGPQSTSSSATAGSAAAPAASAIPSAAQPSYQPANAPSRALGLEAGPDYQLATLRSQLEAAVRAAAADGALKRAAALPASAQLRACVQRLASGVRPGTLVLLQSAHLSGRPATVIVVSSGNGYLAWVVAPGCSAAGADVLARTALPGI